MRKWIDLVETVNEEDWEEDWEEPVPALKEQILRKGTILIHGTNGDFDESDGLQSPVWVTNSRKTATYFSQWKEDEGEPRLTWWELKNDIILAEITEEYFEYLDEYLDINTSDGPDDVLQHLKLRGFDGWIIPDNYGTGEADICLYDASVLSYIKTTRNVDLHEAAATLNKFWITASGERLSIASGGHHADEVDESWEDAFASGWVRGSRSGHEYNIQFDPETITRRAIMVLLKMVSSPLDYVHVDHLRGNDNTYTRRGFVEKMREILANQNEKNIVDTSAPIV